MLLLETRSPSLGRFRLMGPLGIELRSVNFNLFVISTMFLVPSLFVRKRVRLYACVTLPVNKPHKLIIETI